MRQSIKAYLNYLRGRNYSPNTIETYERIFSDLEQYFPDRELDAITLTDLIGYREYMGWKSLSPSSRNTVIGCLKGLYKWYCTVNDLSYSSNPTIHLDQVKAGSRIPSYLTPEQVNFMRVKARNLLERTILEVMLSTGIRATELCDLDIQSYSSDLLELRVIGKGDKERIVPVTEHCQGILDNYIPWSERFRSEEAPLFIRYMTGKRMDRRHLGYIIHLMSGGMAYPHLIRHTTATRMLAGGANLREVQELLGHSNLNTTAIYAHVTAEFREKHEAVFGEQVVEEPEEKPKKKKGGKKNDDTK